MSFGSPPSSIPLDKALKPKAQKEYSEDILKLLELGIPELIAISWFEGYDKALTAKGGYRMDFFDYFLENATLNELNGLIVNKITPKQQTLLDDRINSDDWGVTEEERGSLVSQYIVKNKELIEKASLLQQDNNKLYQDIAKLQGERDKLRENVEGTLTAHIECDAKLAHYESLCNELVLIFKKHKLVEDISEDNVDLLYSVIKEVK